MRFPIDDIAALYLSSGREKERERERERRTDLAWLIIAVAVAVVNVVENPQSPFLSPSPTTAAARSINPRRSLKGREGETHVSAPTTTILSTPPPRTFSGVVPFSSRPP